MILGLSTSTYTLLHVLISLAAIASGLVVLFGMLQDKRLDGWTGFFLITTVLTSVTGFGFPFEHLSPAHKIGILSLVALAIAIAARYLFKLAGIWRSVYVATATLALYFNVFVLVVQSFMKIPALKATAPTQTEPPFVVAQGIVFLIFLTLGIMATRKFRLDPIRAV